MNQSVQFSHSVMCDSLWPHELQHARPPCPSPTPKFTQTHIRRVSDAIQPCHPRSSPSPPAHNPCQHRVFSNESTLRMRWPKYWSFSFSIIPSKEIPGLIFSWVQFSRSVVSDALWPHESQHTRPPCPSPTPGVHSDSHPSSQWCHPAISSSVVLFSSCP